MKGKILIAASLIIASCSVKTGWTEAELGIVTSNPPLRVLTIEDAADSLVLRTPCSDLSDDMLLSPEYTSLASLMVATVTDPSQDGVGIAGPQVGISRRVIAVQRFDKPGEPFEVYPNVRIVATRGDLCSGPEGCLSIPGRRGNVLRYRDIDVEYTLVSPAPHDTTERIQGFTAVIFQHECDHLDGVLYIDKLADNPADGN